MSADDLAQHPLLRRRRMKRQHLLHRLAHLRVRNKRRAHPLPHPPPLQLQPQLQVEELLKDQPPVRRRRRAPSAPPSASPPQESAPPRSASSRAGKPQPLAASPAAASPPPLACSAALHSSSSKDAPHHPPHPLRAQLRSPRRRAAQRLVHRHDPPHLQHRELRVLAVAPASGRISNCGWIIFSRVDPSPSHAPIREASSFPYSATICPSLKRSFRYVP